MNKIILFFIILLCISTQAFAAAPERPGPGDRCPVCGMYVDKYDQWVATILFRDGTQIYFDGPMDLVRYYVELSDQSRELTVHDILSIYVTDYLTGMFIPAEEAAFVSGSDVMGSMGPEWVPFGSKLKAEQFLKDHEGKELLSFDQILTSALSRDKMNDLILFGRYEPLGVMGGHTHHAGGSMVTYRSMFMGMDGNRAGSDRVSKSEVLKDFMVSPIRMSMEMHMLGVMFAPTHDLTLAFMAPYVRFEMDHENRMGVKFTTKSRGVGDVKLSAIYDFAREGKHRILLNGGLSLPTGSIDERDDTPTGPDQKLPYPMQLGSGTFDLLPGITYVGQSRGLAWGSQVMGTIRLGENSNDYTLGDQYEFTAWLTRRWNRRFSTSARIDGKRWGNINGADPDLNPMMVPTADPDRRAGKRADLLLGISYDLSDGGHIGHRFVLEGGIPVYQYLDGPQLETDWRLTVGWQWAF